MGEVLKQILGNWASGCCNGTGSSVEVSTVICELNPHILCWNSRMSLECFKDLVTGKN